MRNQLAREQRARGETVTIHPLKLIIMSATLRVSDFTENRFLFPIPPPVVNVEARTYPVKTHFAKRTELNDYVGEAVKKVSQIHRKLPPGGVLVFLTGQSEIEAVCAKLRARFDPKRRRKAGTQAARDQKRMDQEMEAEQTQKLTEAMQDSTPTAPTAAGASDDEGSSDEGSESSGGSDSDVDAGNGESGSGSDSDSDGGSTSGGGSPKHAVTEGSDSDSVDDEPMDAQNDSAGDSSGSDDSDDSDGSRDTASEGGSDKEAEDVAGAKLDVTSKQASASSVAEWASAAAGDWGKSKSDDAAKCAGSDANPWGGVASVWGDEDGGAETDLVSALPSGPLPSAKDKKKKKQKNKKQGRGDSDSFGSMSDSDSGSETGSSDEEVELRWADEAVGHDREDDPDDDASVFSLHSTDDEAEEASKGETDQAEAAKAEDSDDESMAGLDDLIPAGKGETGADAAAEAGGEDKEEEEEEDLMPVHVLPLYALLPRQQQLKVFQPVPKGHRLIVVSTNVAETSVTIPGVRYERACAGI